MEIFIKKISEIRKRKGLSYENIALDLNLSVSAYRKIETGETKLTVERLVEISKILETPLIDFLETNSQKILIKKIRIVHTYFKGLMIIFLMNILRLQKN